MEFIDEKTIKLDKEINALDRFALDFIAAVEKYTKYVIICGYVAILFGRSRGTEDVDMFLQMNEHEFSDFFTALEVAAQCV
jgi:hypothetical protein